ncbi:MAG: DUF3540 domain-containing protein [Gammaproteobacteria bacterium]|nr:DUF3540 domain-containing protein [Gammaproteobacteria bacterium]
MSVILSTRKNQSDWLQTAYVIKAENGHFLVQFEKEEVGERHTAWVESALAGSVEPQAGDRVLVIGETSKQQFISGIVSRVQKTENKLRASNGISAQLYKNENSESIQIKNESGALLFEYDCETKKCYLNVPEGDLQLGAPNGNIELIAAKGIKATSAQDISLGSMGRVSIAVGGDQSSSALHITDSASVWSTPALKVKTEKLGIDADYTVFKGESMDARLNSVKLTANKMEQIVGDMWQRVKSIFVKAEERYDVDSKRMNTRVEKSYRVLSESACIKAEQDMKIDGDRIHLG